MKTIGAGVAASAAFTGIASADHRSKGRSKHLDPLWGHTGIVEDIEEGFPSPNDLPPQIRPAHRVKLHIDRPLGFHFHPAGLHVQPGDIVMFELHSPDHTVTAYHERFRGVQRVPDGVGPFSSPVLPVGGYWLYRFGEEGVYDLMCAPHEFMGMVMRIVADDGEGTAPEGYGPDGPTPVHFFNHLKELGLAPENPPFHFPSSLEALTSNALDPENILDEGEVDYAEVFGEYNPGI